MKKLTRLLSWVLVLALALTMFSGAVEKTSMAYADSGTLTPAGEEAVAVLTALGIVNGYTDGTFGGENAVTRAEFAKMISLASAGGDVSELYAASALPFSDHFDAWCVPYVNFCYVNGIIAGYGDGTMKPSANVTGFEAVKMTLVALGYDPETEGLVGSSWQSGTARLARRIGLLENLGDENLYSAFDREATAILVRNAIYAETVEYTGGSAVETGLTLGEKVYDLLDIRGIVAANEYTGSTLVWKDVLGADGQYNREAEISYDKTNAGQTRFVYRDYASAATVGGYYVPRVVTAAVATDNSDIGRAYRVLTTGAQNPANTSEVRHVYGVIGEIDSGDEYTCETSGLTAGMIRAAACCFINGETASADEAAALLDRQGETSAPWYYWVDNNADGTVDTVYMYELAVARVLAADEDAGTLTLSGVGKPKAYLSDDGTAVNDYVVCAHDLQYDITRKLDVIEGKVTAYSKNSHKADFYNESYTEGGGEYTIEGAQYTFGALSRMLDDVDTDNDYFEDLLGEGTAALYGTTCRFVMDGSYIVAVFTTDESYWSNYAVIVDIGDDEMLGMRSVRLLTDDNEYKDFYVASYDGDQLYDTVTSEYSSLIFKNVLVRYEEIGDHVIALYSSAYQNVNSRHMFYVKGSISYYDESIDGFITESSLGEGFALGYNATTGNWEDEFRAPFTWDSATVFVAVPQTPANMPIEDGTQTIAGAAEEEPNLSVYGFTWRAYRKGEFQPTLYDDFLTDRCYGVEMVYADGLNGVATIKSAALVFDQAYLPGLVLRSDAIWGTIMSATSVRKVTDSEDAAAKYAYSVEILKPYSTSTETVTIYADSALNTFVKGDIYKLYMSDDGICRRFEHAGFNTTTLSALWYDIVGQTRGDNYLELGRYMLSYTTSDGEGGYYLYLKYPLRMASGLAYLAIQNEVLHLSAGTDAYFTKNLFSTDISAWNHLSNTTSLGDIKLTEGLTVYADFNPTTKEIYSVWFDDSDEPWTITAECGVTLESYNVNTREAVYAVQGLEDSDAVTDYKVTLTQAPNELFCPVGDESCAATVTLEYNMHGQYEITKLAPVEYPTWTTYSRKNAQTVVWQRDTETTIIIGGEEVSFDAVGDLLIWTPDSGNEPAKDYIIKDYTQIFWYRENFGRVDGIAGKKNRADATITDPTSLDYYLSAGKLEPASFYKYIDEAVNEFINANGQSANSYLAYNADGDASKNDAYNYEKFSVLSDAWGNALIIVLIDTDHTNAPRGIYPYAADTSAAADTKPIRPLG